MIILHPDALWSLYTSSHIEQYTSIYQDNVVFWSIVWQGKSVLATHLIMFQELLFDLFLTNVSL